MFGLMESTFVAKDLSKEFQSIVQESFKKAKQNGWTHLGEHSFKDIEDKIKDTLVIENPENLTNMVGGRQTAMWDPTNISVNKLSWEKAPKRAKAGIACHELLRFHGYIETHYESCLRLEIMQTEKA